MFRPCLQAIIRQHDIYLCFYVLCCLMLACRQGRNMYHFLIYEYNKRIVMCDGRKYEILLVRHKGGLNLRGLHLLFCLVNTNL